MSRRTHETYACAYSWRSFAGADFQYHVIMRKQHSNISLIFSRAHTYIGMQNNVRLDDSIHVGQVKCIMCIYSTYRHTIITSCKFLQEVYTYKVPHHLHMHTLYTRMYIRIILLYIVFKHTWTCLVKHTYREHRHSRTYTHTYIHTVERM